jgi:hypothetical protein
MSFPGGAILLVSAPTLVRGQLLGWNATTQVQKPLKIIWEKLPTSAMAKEDLGATLHSPEVPITSVGPNTSMRALCWIECDKRSLKTIEDYMEKVPTSAMEEEGPGPTLHTPEVPITSVGPDTSKRAPLGMECNNPTPKTIEDYMKKSAYFRYGRIGSWCNTSFPGGANY